MARVMVSVPSFEGRVKSLTAEAIGNLDRGGNDVVHRYVSGYGIANARNAIAKAALEGGFDYVLMVDSDVVPPSHALVSLLSHGEDVCMGWVVRGSSDDGRTNAIKLGTPSYIESYYADEILDNDGLMRVKGNGMSLALIRTSVFERVPRPWFNYVEHNDGSALGEDYYFCQQCNAARIPLYVDPKVGCGHVHDRVLKAERYAGN